MSTDFQEQVWRYCAQIPRGRVTSYRLLAKAIGSPQASRAVGNALNKNPYAPEVPCHRVVKNDGRLGGYAGGTAAKARILRQEGVFVKAGRVVDFRDKLFTFAV